MKTKDQKKEIIKEAEKLISENGNAVFVDFTGIADESLKGLRNNLREKGATTKIIKKRLLRVALGNKKVEFNPEQFDAQVATIFSKGELLEVATPVYKFFKEHEKEGFKILGAYDLAGKNFVEADMVKMIGQLPSREVLLSQFIGMLQAPMKMFMYVLDQKSKQN